MKYGGVLGFSIETDCKDNSYYIRQYKDDKFNGYGKKLHFRKKIYKGES